MATFFNQATLSYNGRVMNSNITEGELINTLGAAKSAITTSYTADDRVVYAINLVNSGNTALTNATVTDNLGAYSVGVETVYPLSYVDGSIKYYVNGVITNAPTVTAGPPLVISGINLPAGANALIIYEAVTNEFAPLAIGSSITNAATMNADGIEPIELQATINAEAETRLNIAKAMSPAVISDNGELTYTFIIQNSGNTPILATDDVIVSDVFNPILNPISVTFNGTEWSEGVNYTYDEATGEFTTLAGQITVPAAEYTQDSETGVFTVTPGVAVITVTGTV